MNWVVTIYAGLLFFLLSPKVLLSLPPRGNKYVVALTHSIVFAFVFYFTSCFINGRVVTKEGISPMTYQPNPEKDNPSGPPSINACNHPNVGKVNSQGQVCYHDDKSQTYYFDYNCTQSNVGVKNRDGKKCMAQTDSSNKATYNFV
jgi:hypothetical protein